MNIFVTKLLICERDKEKSGAILMYGEGFFRGRSRKLGIAVEKYLY